MYAQYRICLSFYYLHVRLQAAFLRVAGKPVRELAKVNLPERIGELGLDQFVPVSAWPALPAVRELATKVKALKRAAPDRTGEPYANCELRKCVGFLFGFLFGLPVVVRIRFLPALCKDARPVVIEEVSGTVTSTGDNGKYRRLEPWVWLMAFDRHVL